MAYESVVKSTFSKQISNSMLEAAMCPSNVNTADGDKTEQKHVAHSYSIDISNLAFQQTVHHVQLSTTFSGHTTLSRMVFAILSWRNIGTTWTARSDGNISKE